jgi:cyclopropane fatty-acyl-phospholipid synthase-like methyltransferase
MERVEVVGVTLSRERLTVARERAKQGRPEERVRFALQDYREVEGQFDRIVSVGMFRTCRHRKLCKILREDPRLAER